MTIHRPRPAVLATVGNAECLVRVIYRVVIIITSLYFYLSIPLLILIVLAASAVTLIFLCQARSLSLLQPALFVGAAALYTLYAVVRSIFTRIRMTEPGRPLSRDEAPQLWAMAEEVADRVNTRPVDAIFLTPLSSISVTERGGLLEKLRAVGQRHLILGLGALSGMTQGQLKAILAHEYGHFSMRDTAGGDLAFRVQVS